LFALPGSAAAFIVPDLNTATGKDIFFVHIWGHLPPIKYLRFIRSRSGSPLATASAKIPFARTPALKNVSLWRERDMAFKSNIQESNIQ